MGEKDWKPVTVRLPVSLWRRTKKTAIDRDVKVQELVAAALGEYLRNGRNK